MKLNVLVSSVAIGLLSSMAFAGTVETTVDFDGGVTGSLDIVESLENGIGVYNVANNTTGALLGFGVSNNYSTAVLLNDDGFPDIQVGCIADVACYGARTLGRSDWDEVLFSTFDGEEDIDHTFQSLYGNFETAAGGDNVFHWYEALEGSLQAGASANNFFGFFGFELRSSIIGLGQGPQGGMTAFTAGQAVVAGGPSSVPLPAAGFLMLAGLGGLGVASRRKKS